MIIHFTDPGYDWTIWIVCGIIVAVPALIALILTLVDYSRRGRGRAGDLAFGFWFATVIMAVLSLFVSGITGSIVYDERKDALLYEELEKAGFDGIKIDYNKYEDDILSGELNGEPFVGTIENLHYPKDFAYRIGENSK